MDNNIIQLAEILQAGGSYKEFFREKLESAINEILKVELSAFLGYEKYSYEGYGKENSRNGFYEREIDTEFGKIHLKIPRDRLGLFCQKTVAPYNRRMDSLETTIIQLYSKGVTTREISELVEKMYGCYYTPATVSNITRQLENLAKEFHTRTVDEKYAAIELDATYLHVRRNTVASEALHVILGITPDGRKEVLDYALYPTEAASNYEEMLRDLKKRGLKEILLFISDGLEGMEDAVHKVYPEAEHQQCWVHLQRTVSRYVRPTDRKEIADELKNVYGQKTKDEAEEQLELFFKNWEEKYKKLRSKFEGKKVFSYYSYPESIQKTIYTSNLIENNNHLVKRECKKKGQFPNEDSLERFICNIYIDYNKKFAERTHRGFRQAEQSLLEMFEKRYK